MHRFLPNKKINNMMGTFAIFNSQFFRSYNTHTHWRKTAPAPVNRHLHWLLPGFLSGAQLEFTEPRMAIIKTERGQSLAGRTAHTAWFLSLLMEDGRTPPRFTMRLDFVFLSLLNECSFHISLETFELDGILLFFHILRTAPFPWNFRNDMEP